MRVLNCQKQSLIFGKMPNLMFLGKCQKREPLKPLILGHRQKQDLAFFNFSLYQGNPLYPLKASFSILTQSRIFLGLPLNTTFLLSLGFLSNPLFSRSWDAKRPHRGLFFPLQGLCFFLFILLSLGCSFLPFQDNLECLLIPIIFYLKYSTPDSKIFKSCSP